MTSPQTTAQLREIRAETCHLTLDGAAFSFEAEGDFHWGENEVLFKKNGVISNSSWEEDGFARADFFSAAEHAALQESARGILSGLFEELGFAYPKDWALEDYHTIVTDDAMHEAIISRTRFLINRDLALSPELIAQRVSARINRRVSSQNPLVPAIGSQNKEFVILRINRPHSTDFNPPHRDGYIDYSKPTLNCWIPIAGCNARSSLPLIPKSHWWNEKDVYRTSAKGGKINGKTYHVPAILKTRHGLDMIRPNPQAGEILMFTPFLVHGAAVNQNNDSTRFSFELRLFDEESGIKA